MKIINKTSFTKLFIPENFFLLAVDKEKDGKTERQYVVNILPNKAIWASQKMVAYKAKSKDGKLYNYVNIKTDWTYNLFDVKGVKNDKGEDDFELSKEYSTMSGQEICDKFFALIKK